LAPFPPPFVAVPPSPLRASRRTCPSSLAVYFPPTVPKSLWFFFLTLGCLYPVDRACPFLVRNLRVCSLAPKFSLISLSGGWWGPLRGTSFFPRHVQTLETEFLRSRSTAIQACWNRWLGASPRFSRVLSSRPFGPLPFCGFVLPTLPVRRFDPPFFSQSISPQRYCLLFLFCEFLLAPRLLGPVPSF